MRKNLFKEEEDVLQELGGRMCDKIQDGWTVLGEDVWNVLWEIFADRSDHSDALMALFPIALDEVIELPQQLFVELGWLG